MTISSRSAQQRCSAFLFSTSKCPPGSGQMLQAASQKRTLLRTAVLVGWRRFEAAQHRTRPDLAA
jgi:hypothetical protein